MSRRHSPKDFQCSIHVTSPQTWRGKAAFMDGSWRLKPPWHSWGKYVKGIKYWAFDVPVTRLFR